MTYRARRSRLSLMAVVSCTAAFSSPALAQTGANTSSLGHSVFLSDLVNPWDMAFLDDGTMFFTEKCHGLSVRLANGEVNALLGMAETEEGGVREPYASTAEDLFCEGQAGMNGVAVDPDFDENRRIYVYSASKMSDPPTNRVMRFTVNEDFTEVSDRTDIVEEIPYKVAASDHPFGGPGAHNGGRIRFNPGDGFLYVTTGDNHNSEIPQSPTSLGGKVLRIDTDGNAAPGNAPPEGFDPRIYTYGHRNVQGIAFHPETHTPIVVEHGPWHSDEITVLENGGNAGWDPRPNMAGRGDCPDDYCGYSPNQEEGMNRYERASFMPMTDFKTYPDAMPPIWDNNGWSQGSSSAAFLTGEQWGEWDGNMVVGVMGIGFGGTPIGQRIDVVELSEDGTSVVDVTEMTLPMGPGRFRSLVQGPDGSLYTAVDEGVIHKLTPGQANSEPAAEESVDLSMLVGAGQSKYTVTCSGCHGSNGRGGPGAVLAGNQNLADASHVASVIIHGQGYMPAFGDQLTDQEVAEIGSYIRNSWGNDFGAITSDQAAAAR